jgi:uncharacterized protein YkwD
MTTSLLGIALGASLVAPHVVPLTSVAAPGTDLAFRPAGVTASVPDRDADVRTMLAALNARRAAKGLAPLQLEPRLCEIAYEHAADMVARSYFDHYTPEGVSPFGRMDEAHYPYGYAGENLALDESAPAAELALWHSPEHRKNILESHYAKVGIAAVRSHDGEIIVEDFSD